MLSFATPAECALIPSSPSADAPPGFELSIVAPAFNEAANVAELARRIAAALEGVRWQLIVVDDDSPDGTAATAKALALADGRISCLRRLKRRGLAGAVIEGVMASAAPFVAVMDADLQHDPTLLGPMLACLREGRADLVIGSRYVAEGSAAAGLSAVRGIGSRVAAWLARRTLRAPVADPVSGFFMIRREAFEAAAPRLSDQGFKILFDLIASRPPGLRILELPFAFSPRHAGESKLDAMAVSDYLGLIVSRLSGNLVPPRALMFFAVGTSGLVVHLSVLRLFLGLGLAFATAQGLAAVTAMTSNYLINNEITYRDRRLRGLRLLVGYLRFCALCGVGLIANVAVADLAERHLHLWWAAGFLGALFGAVWNYVSTSLAVW
ncbi:MAG TPA: glycosyltransferase family 2 protein [Caulobacteraceae bacterium]|jgi:dolichol-phosphate mannosyltransferase